ncbi:MAG: hypothetical protein KAQ98_06790 [Bacteriovoracaceae bacterium]|nr:hypothetical protein [Bacteriovoracaceae bacterium]
MKKLLITIMMMSMFSIVAFADRGENVCGGYSETLEKIEGMMKNGNVIVPKYVKEKFLETNKVANEDEAEKTLGEFILVLGNWKDSLPTSLFAQAGIDGVESFGSDNMEYVGTKEEQRNEKNHSEINKLIKVASQQYAQIAIRGCN